MISPVIDDRLLSALRTRYVLDWERGIHGIRHWLRVRENGLRLARRTGANLGVVELFAFFHDVRRENDGRDPGHGRRGAEVACELRAAHLHLDDAAFAALIYACERHTDGLIEADVTVQTCWDADRLDLGRVDITPNPKRLCTPAARDPAVIAWALRRSQE
jgi:uncharacterized protein